MVKNEKLCPAKIKIRPNRGGAIRMKSYGTYFQNDAEHPLVYGEVELINPPRTSTCPKALCPRTAPPPASP